MIKNNKQKTKGKVLSDDAQNKRHCHRETGVHSFILRRIMTLSSEVASFYLSKCSFAQNMNFKNRNPEMNRDLPVWVPNGSVYRLVNPPLIGIPWRVLKDTFSISRWNFQKPPGSKEQQKHLPRHGGIKWGKKGFPPRLVLGVGNPLP